MAYKDKPSYASSPPCNENHGQINQNKDPVENGGTE